MGEQGRDRPNCSEREASHHALPPPIR